jgi:hypothetical protein
MAEASLDWKIGCLRTIQTMPPAAAFEEGITPQETLIWVQDLERDGYITAKFRMGIENVPNLIWNVHVLEKGKQLIADFESQRTVSGIWKKYHINILKWAITVLTSMLIGYLLRGLNLK